MIVFLLLLGSFIAVVLYYVIGLYNEHYWKNRGVVYYTKNRILGPMWEYLRTDQPLFQILHENLYKKFPNEPAIGFGPVLFPSLYVRDLENIQHVLQSDFQAFNHRGVEPSEDDKLADNILFMHGARWKLTRQALSPLFTTSKMKDMFYIIDKSAKDFVGLIRNNTTESNNKMFDTLCTFCSAAFGAAIFGIQTESIFDSPFLKVATAFSTPTTENNLKFAVASLVPKVLKNFRIQRFAKHADFFIGAIKQLIRQREQEDNKRHDFGDMCVTLQKNGTLRDSVTGYELEPTDELLAAQAFFFYAAGVEPIATLIYSVFIELGRNPEILKKVHDEIDQVWEKHHGVLSYEAINEIEYLDKVMNEALRMYPPVGFLIRLCVRDSVLPVGNIKVSKGTRIFTPIFSLHHDPKFYADPEVFDPERFTGEKKSNDVTYQPFGRGPRLCLGLRYGHLQAKTGIIHILREFSPSTTVLDGGIKFSKQGVQVRPCNVNVELVSRTIKSN